MKLTTVEGMWWKSLRLPLRAWVLVSVALVLSSVSVASRSADLIDSIQQPDCSKRVDEAEITLLQMRTKALAGSGFWSYCLYVLNAGGSNPDLASASVWLRRSADAGFAHSQFLLSRRLAKGDGMRKDAREAARWLAEAADSGIPAYEVVAAWSFEKDGAVPADLPRAFAWMRSAARAGLGVAQTELARYYVSGLGVARDEVQAVFWLRHAAAQGEARAFLMLGHVYRRGFAGASQAPLASTLNPALAVAMFRLAILMGEGEVRAEAAQNLSETKATMSSTDQQAGEDFAALWKPGVDLVEQMDLVRTSLATGTPVGSLPGADQRAPSKLTATGSGFFVNANGAVVTNRHVIDGCKAVRVLPQGLQSRNFRMSQKEDLALVLLDQPTPNFARLSSRDSVDLGEQVLTAGFPLRFVLENGVSITQGMVSASGGWDGDRGKFQMTAPIQPGNSGGPVIDLNGKVVGVVVSSLNPDAVGTEVESVNYAVALATLQGFLRQSGIAIAEDSDDEQELPTKVIARSAGQFTVSLECWE